MIQPIIPGLPPTEPNLPESIHIVGVNGSATSGLAQILTARGVRVTGSDAHGDPQARLGRAGISVEIGHRRENLPDRVGLVVHSAAVASSNPELEESRRRGVEVLKYAQFLGRLLETSFGLAVAGTHGKTSTAAMLASVWVAAGRKPTVLLGGQHRELGGNWCAGSGSEFVVEACEFDRSFLSLHPRAAIITNLELDHPDIYADLSDVQESFARFVDGMRDPGIVILGSDSRGARELRIEPSRRVVTAGLSADAEWRALPIEGGERPRFEVMTPRGSWGEFTLGVPGRHNLQNALQVIALAGMLDVPRDAVAGALEEFAGVDRRFEVRGKIGSVPWVDDFAHHPTELETTIATAREVFPERRLRVLFQPHQVGRMRRFGGGFAEALAAADRVGLFPIYSVREAEAPDAEQLLAELAETLVRCGVPVDRYDGFEAGVEAIPPSLAEDEIVLACSAGNLIEVSARLVGGDLERGAPGNLSRTKGSAR